MISLRIVSCKIIRISMLISTIRLLYVINPVFQSTYGIALRTVVSSSYSKHHSPKMYMIRCCRALEWAEKSKNLMQSLCKAFLHFLWKNPTISFHLKRNRDLFVVISDPGWTIGAKVLLFPYAVHLPILRILKMQDKIKIVKNSMPRQATC